MRTRRGIVAVGLVGVGFLVLSLVSATVYAGPKRGVGRMMRHLVHPRVLKALGLTDEQKTQLREIKVAHRTTFRELRSQMRAIRTEIANKVFAPGEMTAEDFTDQVAELTKLRGVFLEEGLTVALKVRALLTPEQLAEAARLSERTQVLRAEMRSLYQKTK